MIGSYVDFGIRMDHSSLDITDLSQVRAMCHEHKPKVIIHLAAATDLARCEREPDFAHRVNTVGTYNVALVAREIGAKVVYVSTSGVFDGTKEAPWGTEDVPNPQNQYAHSKYLGELAVQGILADHLIVRTSWVFGGGPTKDQKFVGKVMRQLDQSEIQAVADKRGSPAYGKDVIEGIKRLLAEGKSGVYHMGILDPLHALILRERS
jgi:dTDP-4-dehydrorhamnose reductase